MSHQDNESNPGHESATFYVSSADGRLARRRNNTHWNAVDDLERVLEEYCEPVMPLPGSRRRHTRVVGTVVQRHQKERWVVVKQREIS